LGIYLYIYIYIYIIVVLLPSGKTQFSVKIDDNNRDIYV
jgi:hypothetical protein